VGVSEEAFERARGEPDSLTRARLATELIAVYQQRSAELARLRRVAIDQAAHERGLSMAAVAAEIGLSKGRITQIRQSAPPAARALFGVGPVTVAVPTRAVGGRALPVISAEDSIAAEMTTALLGVLGFAVEQYRIPVGGAWTPTGDVIAICGPESSPVTAEAIATDPTLAFTADPAGRWTITDRATGQRFTSGLDDDPPSSRDMAYLGRALYRGGSLLIVAGIHAIGSVGAVHYLTRHTADLYETVAEHPWSAIIASTHDGDTITKSELACPPQRH
jgi:hypothetical protein